MAGRIVKGALISFTPSFIGLTPNVIVFQTNPESIVHTWTAAASPPQQAGAGKVGPAEHVEKTNPLAVAGNPGEAFAFTVILDANDDVADGAINPIAAGIASLSGVYARLAAIELLQFPPAPASGVVGQVSAAISAALQGTSASQNTAVQESDVPVALFVWGPGRIVPVRVTALTVSEKLYDAALNPTHAEAQITIRVLTLDELGAVQGPMHDISKAAYEYTQTLRQGLAIANLGDAASSILGMLPTPV